MRLAQIALLFVVVIDVMGQGLVLPLVTTLVMDPSLGLLATGTSDAERELAYGLAIGAFFLSWFLGAAYISKISDSIGRKNGIMICLAGGFVGYVLTIVAIEFDSYALLVIGRIISGFTAGNQPIAQAALVDMSRDERQKTHFMGLVVMALSGGLLLGPVLAGVLSDRALLGSSASLELPFYVAAGLTLANALLIVVFFHDSRAERRPFRFNPVDILAILWQALHRPLVRKLAVVFFFSQLVLNSIFVFMDEYFTVRFGFGTFDNSLAMVVLGLGLGLSSGLLVGPVSACVAKKPIIIVTLGRMGMAAAALIINPWPWLAYVLIFVVVVPFGVNYPIMLTLFSASVDETEQGWVMGVTVALVTLGAGLISLVGGELMSIDIHMPFIVSLAACCVAIALVALLWRQDVMARLDPR
jgi:MFS family permease